MWSNDRFSSISTTMCWIVDRPFAPGIAASVDTGNRGKGGGVAWMPRAATMVARGLPGPLPQRPVGS